MSVQPRVFDVCIISLKKFLNSYVPALTVKQIFADFVQPEPAPDFFSNGFPALVAILRYTIFVHTSNYSIISQNVT